MVKQTALAAVLVLGLAAVVQAQEVVSTVNIFPQSMREIDTYTVPSVNRPVPSGFDADYLRFVITMTDAEAANPANRFWIRLYSADTSVAGGWRFVAGGPWQGGVVDPETGRMTRPFLEQHIKQLRPSEMRLEVESFQRMRWGADLERIQ